MNRGVNDIFLMEKCFCPAAVYTKVVLEIRDCGCSGARKAIPVVSNGQGRDAVQLVAICVFALE
jgi:hypothetical protein